MNFLRLLWLFLILLGSCNEKTDSKPDPLKKERLIEFVDMNGDTITLSSFTGKRVLVNYWATWCIPCRKEFPSLLKAEHMLRDENYVFLFPTTDEFELIREFKAKQGYDLRFLKMNSSLASMNILVLPTTEIYGTDGKLFRRISGAMEWDKEQVVKMLKDVP